MAPAPDKHQALREQLTHQPSAACAQSAAHGKFLAARRRPRQQQIREIYADDQQNQAHRAPQYHERPPQFTAYVFLQLRKLAGVTFSVFRVFMLEIELRKELIGLALCLRQTHAWFQAANQRQVVSVIAEVIHDVRSKEVDLCSRRKNRAKIECFRQDSHNRHRRVAQVNGPSDDTAIAAQLPLPERIA